MEISAIVQQFVDRLVAALHVECAVDIHTSEEDGRPMVHVSLTTNDQARFLIGTHGEHLKALEHILRLMVTRHNPTAPSLALDINGYKQSRATQAVQAAREALQRVRMTGKPEALLPMSAFERRAVHTELMNYPDIATESIGEEPQRRVVIKLS